MRIALFWGVLVSFFSASEGFSAQTVILLTSFVSPGKERTAELLVERVFRRHYEPKGYRVRVVHHANPYDLWTELHSPEPVALYWVSHSSRPWMSPTPGLLLGGAVADFERHDVLPLFQEVHPNLRLLVVLGCYAKHSLEPLLTRFKVREKNPQLRVESEEGIAASFITLYAHLLKTDSYLSKPEIAGGYSSPCPKSLGIPLKVRRILGDSVGVGANSEVSLNSEQGQSTLEKKKYPAIRLESRGKVLGVFPPVFGEGSSEQELFLPLDPSQARSFDMTVKSGALSLGDPSLLGKFDFEAEGGSWALFRDSKTGQPFGVTQNTYLFHSWRDGAPLPKEYFPFECRPMPSRLDSQSF